MRRRIFIGGVVVAFLVLAIGTLWYADRRLVGHELETARKEIVSGQFLAAQKRLESLSNRPFVNDAVWLARGDCEMAFGESKKAVESWAKIGARSPEVGQAMLRLGQVAMDQRAFALAEERFEIALREPGRQRAEAEAKLSTLLKFQGRFRDVRKLIKSSWEPGTSPVDVVRELWRLDYFIYPIEAVKTYLARSSQLAPDDDRVWLARANLAIRLGEFAEAEVWLNRCRKRRPDDQAVWRSQLEWALATDQLAAAAEPLANLLASQFEEDEIQSLRARFASGRRDLKAEREALIHQIEGELQDSRPIDRLAEVALLENDTALASRMKALKLDYVRWRDTYNSLIGNEDLDSRAAEMAELAEKLGRRFEARAWWDLAVIRDPSLRARAEASLARQAGRKNSLPPSTRLAELVDPRRSAELNSSSGLLIPTFVDDADKAGLKVFFENGQSRSRQLPETTSGGVALLDYDGDGWVDVYALQGGRFPPDPSVKNQDRLFRNLRSGRFEDVTEASGLAGFAGGYSHGVAVGDIDNDGDPDLFVTRWRSYALYRNNGNGTFDDITQLAGLDGDRDWPTSAAFADLDNDGDLDLFVCHYLAWDISNPAPCPQDDPDHRYYCYPRLFRAMPDRLYRNDAGRFVDVTALSGVGDLDGRGLGVVAGDVDNDGLVDLYVVNDATANLYHHNLGAMKFEEIAATSGLATGATGAYQAGMGVTAGDQNGDGLLDFAVTNFYAEGTTLYTSVSKNAYFDHSQQSGLAATSRNFLGFGVAFLDANDDGLLDLAAANGHVNDGRPKLPYAMPARLWLGSSRSKLVDVSTQAGEPWQVPHLGRGLATGDLDNDGRIDLLIVSELEPLAYFHNTTRDRGHVATFRLEGKTSNRDAIGARVTLKLGVRSFTAQQLGGGSFQSASDPRLHFGLGSATRVDSVEVVWPSGHLQRWTDLPADRGYRLREGDPQAVPRESYPY